MVFNNAITNLGTTMGDFGDQFGIDVVNAGPTPTSIRIDNNQITFNNGRNTGMRFDLAADSNVSITNNEFLELFDQGTGILFTSVRAPASFFIENNLIGLTDNDVLIPGVGGGVDGIEERGIIFSSVSGGVVDLGGTENSVLLLNIGGDTDQFFFFPDPGLANGQIEINGIFVP